MKTLNTVLMIAVLGFTGVFPAAKLLADERTGRELTELVRELDSELAQARTKVETLEKQRQEKALKSPAKILPERGKALRKLEELTNKMDAVEEPEEKKAVSKELEKQVLDVAKHSADFLEYQKNELISQDKQLEVIEEALATVIHKMGKLQKLTDQGLSDGKNTISAETAKKQARRNLHKLAKMVEMLAAKNGKSHRWRNVRQTIVLQDAVLKKSAVSNSRIKEMLNGQRQVYEQVLAQINVARQQIAMERQILGQIALGEVAKSLLRKAAGLLLGNYRIDNIGNAAILKSEKRQQDLLAFMEQEEDNGGVYSGLDDSSSEDYPDGYQAYLDKGIE